jgi:hypothetical protein
VRKNKQATMGKLSLFISMKVIFGAVNRSEIKLFLTKKTLMHKTYFSPIFEKNWKKFSEIVLALRETLSFFLHLIL